MPPHDDISVYVPPARSDRLEFRVFLSSRMNRAELRDKADVALSELNRSYPLSEHVRLIPTKCEHHSYGISGPAQADIEAQLEVPLAQHQIVVGFADQSLGPGMERELRMAVDAPMPRPFVLFFSARPRPPDDLAAVQALGKLMEFRSELEKRHNAVAYSFSDPEDFKKELKEKLRLYIERHLKKLGIAELQKPPVRQPWPPEVSPYPGLRSMKFEDAEKFFGREHDIDEFFGRIDAGQRVLCVRGPSGVGKSSLLMAGLLPRLVAASPADVGKLVVDLSVAQAADGRVDPYAALAAALMASDRHAGVGASDCARLAQRLATSADGLYETLQALDLRPKSETRLLLCLDQAEYFVARSEPHVAERFSRALKASVDAGVVTLLCTLRDDGAGRLSDVEELDAFRLLLNNATHTLGRVSRRGIIRAILKPAEAAGYTFAEKLADRLADDAAGEPNSLPLLAAALEDVHRRWHERWSAAGADSRPARVFTDDLYPGFKDVINRSAARALRLASDSERTALERLYWKMVRVDIGGKRAYPVRIDHAVLASDPGLSEIAGRLDQARLLVSGAEGLEFAHSRILDLWDDLASWIGRSKTDLEKLEYFTMRAERWNQHGRASGELLSWQDTTDAEQVIARLRQRMDTADGRLETIQPFVNESRRIRGLLEGLEKVDFELLASFTSTDVSLTEEECEARWPFYKAMKGTIDTAMTDADWTRIARRGYRPVHFAAFGNNVSILEKADASQFSAVGETGWTPLHMAAYTGAVQAADVLIRAGGNIEVQTEDGSTPFLVAASRGHRSMVEFLLHCGASPHVTDARQRTASHWAAVQDYVDIVQLLADKGADLDAADRDGWTPLHYAASAKSKKVLQYLVQSGRCDPGKTTGASQPPYRGVTALHLAAQAPDPESCRLLLAHAPGLIRARNTLGVTPLHLAARSNAAEVIEVLASAGAEVDARDHYGKTALHDAAANDALQAIESLHRLMGGNLMEGGGRTAPPQQGIKGAPGRTALHFAAHHRQVRACRLLLKLDPRLVHATDDMQETPMHLAATMGAVDVMKQLGAHGADLAARRIDRAQPLHLAACAPGRRRTEVDWQAQASACAWLLSHQGIVHANDRGPDGGTALHWAAAVGELRAIAPVLLEGGGSIDTRDDAGSTPLHYAPAGMSTGARLLMDFGANPDACNDAGLTPLDVALEQPNKLAAAALVWAARPESSRRPAIPWSVPTTEARDAANQAIAALRARGGVPVVWPELPTLHTSWMDLTGPELVSALAALETSQRKAGMPSTLAAHTLCGARHVAVPQYPGYRLVELSLVDPADDRKALAFLWGPRVEQQVPGRMPSDLFLLDGSSEPMHALSCHLPIVIDTVSAAAAHLRMFTGYLSSENSAFIVVDTVQALRLPDHRAEHAWQHLFAQIRPLTPLGSTERSFRFNATLLHRRRLFRAVLRVYRWGMLDMEDDEALSSHPLPTLPDQWSSGYRILTNKAAPQPAAQAG